MAVLRYGIGLCCCDMVLAYAIWYWLMGVLRYGIGLCCCCCAYGVGLCSCVRALVSLPLCLVIDMRFIDTSFRFILEEVSVCGLNKRLRYVGYVY